MNIEEIKKQVKVTYKGCEEAEIRLKTKLTVTGPHIKKIGEDLYETEIQDDKVYIEGHRFYLDPDSWGNELILSN